tara:strand:- start:138 stop:569 length:432 start_codon:yes stop_codon:yes gene_type:complete
MKLLHDDEKLNSLGINSEAKRVLSYMKRELEGMSVQAAKTGMEARKKGGDRESKRWPALKSFLNKRGIPVNKIYGKGGLYSPSLHYSFVLDDKYLLTIYTKGAGKEKWFSNKIAQILNPLYSNKQETNEALRKIFDLINEAMR